MYSLDYRAFNQMMKPMQIRMTTAVSVQFQLIRKKVAIY